MPPKGRKKRSRADTLPEGSTEGRAGLEPSEQGEDSPSANVTSSLPSASQKPPKKRSKPAASSVTPSDAPDAPAPTDDSNEPSKDRPYNTRPTTQGRRPGRDVGLNWQEERRQKDAAIALREQKKADEETRKLLKAHQVELEDDGIHRLAGLDLDQELDDQAEEEYLQASNARGYRRPVSDGEDVVGSGSEDDTPDGDSSSSETDVPLKVTQRRKPKTNAQRKAEKRENILGRIETARHTIKRGAASSAASRKANVNNKTGSVDAFTPAYRQKLLAASQAETASPSRSTSVLPSLLASTPTRSPSLATVPPSSHKSHHGFLVLASPFSSGSPSTSHRGSTQPAVTSSNSDPTATGGLTEDDVAVSRDSIIGRAKGRPRELVDVVEVQPTQPPAAKKKKTRTPKTEVPPDQSLSVTVLPSWIQEVFDASLLPTLLDYYGAQQCPFTLDPKEVETSDSGPSKSPNVVALIQQIMDELCPDDMYTLRPTERFVVITRQRITNWRRAFLARALKAVQAGYTKFTKERDSPVTSEDVAAWARNALDSKAGIAWWKSPATAPGKKSHGLLLSTYIISTLAPHFKSIANSKLAKSDPPIGAVALACAAVDIAFSCYTSGSFVPPTSPFDMTLAGDLVAQFMDDTIVPMLNGTAHRFEKVVTAAREHTAPGRTAEQTLLIRTAPRRRRMVEQSSSPVHSGAE